ncbi:MAG: MFS transporter, partial [Chloroflexi bacterium]|nr:MFS transporter [Chloroflexota bacterium]
MSGTTPTARPAPIWTRDFVILCFAALGAFAGMAFLIPVLPHYVGTIGGSRADIGLVIASFAFTSVALRPFLGRLVDQRGGKVVLVTGTALMMLASALYIAVPSVPLLLALRVFHGAGMAAATTATWALVAELSPADRRGEAMGWFGMFLSGSFAVGPLAGSALAETLGFTAMFAVLTAVVAVSLALALVLRIPPRSAGHAALPSPPLISKAALLPSVIFLGTSTTFAAITSFLPLMAQERELGTAAWFYSLQAVAIFFGRMFGGPLSDRYGRATVAIPANIVLILGMIVLAFADTPWLFFGAAIIHGFGSGAGQPALMAMAVDRAPDRERGAAMATTTTAIDLGFAVSAIPLGLILEATNSFTVLYLAPAVAV